MWKGLLEIRTKGRVLFGKRVIRERVL